MSRAATRRAIEWPRMISGLVLCTLGVLFFRVSDSNVGPALFFFGLVLAGISLLGRGCNVCGKTLVYREFGFSPARVHDVVNAVDSESVDRVIKLLNTPRIGDLDKPRTALMISCCPRCQQIAELIVGELGPGFRTCTERVYNTPDVARLHDVVRHTKKQR